MVVLADTGFWFALYFPGDPHHVAAKKNAHLLDTYPIAFPWPCLYETVNTKFVKTKGVMAEFEALLKNPKNVILDDVDYRDDALEATFAQSKLGKRHISLVDAVMRLMLQDPNVQISGLLTFNKGDFIDVCQPRQIEII